VSDEMTALSDLAVDVVGYDVAADELVVFLSVNDGLDGAMVTVVLLPVVVKGIYFELLRQVRNVLGIVEANGLLVFSNCVIEKGDCDRDIESWDFGMYCYELVCVQQCWSLSIIEQLCILDFHSSLPVLELEALNDEINERQPVNLHCADSQFAEASCVRLEFGSIPFLVVPNNS